MVATQAGVTSIGSRRTRRERRTRKRRARLRKSITTTSRRSAFTVLCALVSVIEAAGSRARRGVQGGVIGLRARLVFTAEKGRIRLAVPARSVLASVRHVAEKGFARDGLLFVGLLGAGVAGATYATMGKASLALLCCLLGVLMGVGLLITDEREGAQ